MRKKILTLALFVGVMVLVTATGVLAASPVVTNPHPTLDEPTPTPTVTPTVTITHPVAAIIAAFFGLDYTTMQTYRDQGIGFGNMTIALFVAHASGSTFEDIMDMRGEEGGGWGYIIKHTDGLEDFSMKNTNLGAIRSGRVTETVTVTVTLRGTANPEKGPKETPPGSEHGKGQGSQGQGHDKGDQGQGHGKGQQGQPQGKGRGPKH